MSKYEDTTNVLPPIGGAAPAHPVERLDLYEDGRAFVLRNVLSAEECDACIQAAVQLGTRSVAVSGYQSRVRVCDRVVAESEPLAALLFSRVERFLSPVDLTSTDLASRPRGVPADRARGLWRPLGLNEMFRVCGYQPGGHFAPHLDGGHRRSGTDASMQTFMAYLSDGGVDFEGGRTRFFDDSQEAYRPPDAAKVERTYVPRKGEVLVFNSELLHDGEAVASGRKWILRSEVMYALERPRADEPMLTPFALMEDGRYVHATCGIHPTLLARLRVADRDAVALRSLCTELACGASERLGLSQVAVIVAPPFGPPRCVVGGSDPLVAIWLLLDPLDIDSKQTTFCRGGEAQTNMQLLYKWTG